MPNAAPVGVPGQAGQPNAVGPAVDPRSKVVIADCTIFGVDKMDPNANVQLTDLRIAGATATVVGASHDRVPIAEAPAPGNTLCGAPLHGSAANFPEAVAANAS